MAWTRDMRRKAKERAADEWRERVLAAPEQYSPLKVLRTQQGILQRDLAKKANMSKGAISEIERGRVGTRSSQTRIAIALGRDISELFPNE